MTIRYISEVSSKIGEDPMKILAAVFLMVFWLSAFTSNIYASQNSKIIKDECTTNSNIYYLKKFRVGQGFTLEQMKAAVLLALGKSTTNPNYETQWLKGQWFHEYTIKNIIFTGYQVRSHYLKVAVQVTPKNVTTIVCDSSNLRQDEDSIHRKVPVWKKQLDTKIRIELGKATAQNNQQPGSLELEQLNNLRKKGVITEAEFRIFKARLN